MKTNYRYLILNENLVFMAGFDEIEPAVEFMKSKERLGGKSNEVMILVAVLQ